jgi:DNA polymerase delta subunit 4
MPPKRRTSGSAPKTQQSTLAFHGAANKVTKAGIRAPIGKKNVISEPVVKDVIKTDIEEPEAAKETAKKAAPTTVEAGIIAQAEQEVAVQQVAPTPEEAAARKITDAKIEKYWSITGGKSERLRVHQEDLSTNEKILRQFDMRGQYGVSAHEEHRCVNFNAIVLI